MGSTTADYFLHALSGGARSYHLQTRFLSDLLNESEDVAFFGWSGGTDDEVGRRQSVKMRYMAVHYMSAVVEFAQFLSRRRRLNPIHRINGLARGHMMGAGSDASYARHQAR